MSHRILFVCLGNICRSPAAEGVTRSLAWARGLDLVVDSAGTGGWHVGSAPYEPMQEAAKARGYDLSDLRARQVKPADFLKFDLIIGMDRENMRLLAEMRPDHATAKLAQFTEYAPDLNVDHVADPYYTRDFEGALDVVTTCATGLLDQLSGVPGPDAS